MIKLLNGLWNCYEYVVTNFNIHKIDALNLSFERKILDVCVLIIFEGKEKPSMYCICHLSECSLNLVDHIKSSSHLHNLFPRIPRSM